MRLAVLRRYYHQVEEAHKAELARLQGDLNDAQTVRGQLDQAVEDYVQQFLDDLRGGLEADEAVRRYGRIDGLAADMQEADARLVDLRQRLEQKRDEVLIARRETKKLDLLWDRHRQRERQAQQRREQQALDEMAARRHLAAQREHR